MDDVPAYKAGVSPVRHAVLLARFVGCALLLGGPGLPLVAQENLLAQRGADLASRIGCAQCHADLKPSLNFRETPPDLSAAGLRYQTAWLFDYLKNPTRVRQHLGAVRMPDFKLEEREALALALFLETQRQVSGDWPSMPLGLERESMGTAGVSRQAFHAELAGGLVCLTCHDYEGKGGHRALELTNVSARLRPEWIAQYLVAPAKFGVAATNMPAQFFQVTADRSRFQELRPRAVENIQRITAHLSGLHPERRVAQEKTFVEARRRHPQVSASQGEELFRALNCAACHRHHEIAPRSDAAPSLAGQGLRGNRLWLESFLARPGAIRPSGFYPGDGARMPDFRLTLEEIEALGAFLSTRDDGPPALQQEYRTAPRSAFALRKAETLLREKFSCLGCHALDGKGGRLAPDLGSVRLRRRPSYVLNMILDPRSTAPHSIMARQPVPEETARLLADYLLHQGPTDYVTSYLSPLDHVSAGHVVSTPKPGGAAERARWNYAKLCAPCHGVSGRGDGFNAAFLSAKPTAHADAAVMRLRSDDTLFDGIHGGGGILNRSHLMPAWQGLLSSEEMRELVAHMRSLCRCEGPEWSRDDAK